MSLSHWVVEVNFETHGERLRNSRYQAGEVIEGTDIRTSAVDLEIAKHQWPDALLGVGWEQATGAQTKSYQKGAPIRSCDIDE